MKTVLAWLLEQYPDTPKKRARQWITAGRVSVAGEIVRQANRLVDAPPVLLERNAAAIDCEPDGWQIHPRVLLLHLDPDLAIVNKGPGLLAVSATEDELSAQSILRDFLAGKLRSRYELPPAYRRLRPLPVHRLDQYTSGVFCLAMNPTARRRLIDELQSRTMKREYIAFVEGRPARARGAWRNQLLLSADEMRQSVVARGGVEAVTNYETIAEFPRVTKLRLQLDTGRKHQIRVQAAHAGVPLVGDRVYNPQGKIEFDRQALHAAALTVGGRTWRAELPKDLRALEVAVSRG